MLSEQYNGFALSLCILVDFQPSSVRQEREMTKSRIFFERKRHEQLIFRFF